MKRFALLSLAGLLLTSFSWSQIQSETQAESALISHGATALFDTTYYPTEDENYMTLGMELPFDKLILSLKIEDKEDRDENEDNEEPKLQIEYRSSENSWKKLSGTASPIQKDSYGVQLFTFNFTAPADFKQSNFMGENAHWVRVTKLNDPTRNITINQTAARAYSLSLHIESSTEEELTTLATENFTLSEGGDNKLYGLRNRGNGNYDLAIQTMSDDMSYRLAVAAPNHLVKSMYVSDLNTSNVTKRDMELSLKVDCTSPYKDLDYHWAQSSVRELECQKEVETGEKHDPEVTQFYPNAAVTRLEFVEAAMERAQVDIKNYRFSDTPFRDIKDEPAVSAAWRLGYLDDAREFRPNEFITRGDAIKILVRTAGIRLGTAQNPFIDVSASDEIAPYLRAAYNYQIVEGYADRTFKPNNKLTRAEFATVLNNTFYAWK